MTKFLFVNWQAKAQLLLSCLECKFGLRAMAEEAMLQKGVLLARATDVPFFAELLKVKPQYPQLWQMISPSEPDFTQMTGEHINKPITLVKTCFKYLDPDLCAISPADMLDLMKKNSKGTVTGFLVKEGYNEAAKGGIPHAVIEWWRACTPEQREALKTEATQLSVHLWNETEVFSAAKAHGGRRSGAGAATLKPCLSKLGSKNPTPSVAAVHDAFAEQYSDAYILMACVLMLLDDLASAPSDVLASSIFEGKLPPDHKLQVWYASDLLFELAQLAPGNLAALAGDMPPESLWDFGPTLLTLLTMEPDRPAPKPAGEEEEREGEDSEDGKESGDGDGARASKRARTKTSSSQAAAGASGAAAGGGGGGGGGDDDGGGGGNDEEEMADKLDEELILPEFLSGLRKDFVEVCLTHYGRQGPGGHPLLAQLLGVLADAIASRPASKLGWLKDHLLDVVTPRVVLEETLPSPVVRDSLEYKEFQG